MINPYTILGGLAALAASFAMGMATNGYMRDAKDNAELLAAQSAAIQIKEAWNAEIADQRQESEDAKRELTSLLADALERVQHRPNRLPEPARAACRGATGAELANRDAAAFERYGARAREFQIALGECQAWIKTVRGGNYPNQDNDR